MGRPRRMRTDLPERVYHRNGAYYFVHPGTGKWERLNSDYAKAMARWAETINTSSGLESSQPRTVRELLDRYLLEVVPKKAERTQKDNRQEVRFLRAFFGEMVCSEVEPRHVALYIESRDAKTRANREVALLSHAFNKAILWGVCKTNPCSVPGLRNRENPRDRYVEDEEIETFEAFCPDWLVRYIELKCILSLRQQDMLALKHEDIKRQKGFIEIWIIKTQRWLKVKLSEELESELKRLSTSSGNLFQTRQGKPYTSAGFSSIWRRLMAKYVSAGNKRFHEHDIRGKVATDIGNPHAAQKLLGHAKMAMTEAYIKQRTTDVVEPNTRRKKHATHKS